MATITEIKESLIRRAKYCPYCGGIPKLTHSKIIYGEGSDFGFIYLCQCGAYVGCHKGTKKPLGRVADKTLRKLKIETHNAFDQLWKNGHFIKRNEAYAWLSVKLKIKRRHTHIGMFDEVQCINTIAFCNCVLTGEAVI